MAMLVRRCTFARDPDGYARCNDTEYEHNRPHYEYKHTFQPETDEQHQSRMANHRAWLRELRDMTRCPDCHQTQKPPRTKSGQACAGASAGCESEIWYWQHGLIWTNQNWG